MDGSVVLVALCILFTGHFPSSYPRTTETTLWPIDVTDRDQTSWTDQTTDTTQVTEEDATASWTDHTSTAPAYSSSSERTTDTTQVTEEEGTASTDQSSTCLASSSSSKQTTENTRVTEEEGTSWTVQTSTELPISSSSTVGTPDTTRVTEEKVTTTSQHTTSSTVGFSQSSIPVTTEQETMISVDHPDNIGLYIGLSLGNLAIVGSLIITLILYRQRRLCFKTNGGDRMMRNQPDPSDIVSQDTFDYQPNLQMTHMPTEMSVYGNRSAERGQHEEAPEYYNEYPLSPTGAHTYMNSHINARFQAAATDYSGPHGPYDLPHNVRYEGIIDSEHLYLSIVNQ